MQFFSSRVIRVIIIMKRRGEGESEATVQGKKGLALSSIAVCLFQWGRTSDLRAIGRKRTCIVTQSIIVMSRIIRLSLWRLRLTTVSVAVLV